MKEDLQSIILAEIEALKEEGLEPDIILAGGEFLLNAGDLLVNLNLKIYEVEELGYDAVIADSQALGLMKKASRRVSVDPFLKDREREAWGELGRV